MFIVKPRTMVDHQFAIEVLGHYDVNWYLPEGDTVRIIVSEGEDLALAEMAFQMHMHQDNKRICWSCAKAIEKTGEGEAVCGHLTFTELIERP